MATPTVFVSSTFYDLRYAREGLKRFIEQFGYLPVLSEDGAVYYDPAVTAAEACLKEVSSATILVLLIGGRYGMTMPDSSQSVTNAEYQRAVADKVPVFALVEQDTYSDYLVYRANLGSPEVLPKMSFPNADNVKIFEFIDSVRGQAQNNALVPFRTIVDVENYLRSQWAGMVHDYITSTTKEAQVVDTLEMLQRVNERVERIASQILRTVGTPLDRLYVGLMQATLASKAGQDLTYIGASVRPSDVLTWEDVSECAASLERPITVDEDDARNAISGGGTLSKARYDELEKRYDELREQLHLMIGRAGVTLADIQQYEAGLEDSTETPLVVASAESAP